jgi:hypothetical protein
MRLFNDYLGPNHLLLYKMLTGKNSVGCKREREKERPDKGRERQSIGENQKCRGFRKVQLGKTPENL